MTAPVPGWYDDPAGSGGERWWDGSRWTGNLRPPTQAAVPVPAVDPGTAPGGYPTSGYSAGAAASGQGYSAGVATSGQGYDVGPASGQGYGGYGGYGSPAPTVPAGTPGAGGSLVRRNGFSLATVAIGVVYALIALEAQLVFFGLLPIVLTVRAFTRREPLRFLAAVIAAAALAFFLYTLSH